MNTMTMPQNIEAEKSLIGTCLLGGQKAIDAAGMIIDTNDFFLENHRVIWDTILRLSLKGTIIDSVTVSDALGSQLDRVGGRVYLVELTGAMPRLDNIEEYANIIKSKSLARAKIQANNEENRRLFEGANSEEITSRSMVTSLNLLNNRRKTQFVRAGELISAVYERIEASVGSNGITGTPSGYPDFDQIGGGLQSGFILLAARPSVGKTTLALNIARNVANLGMEVLIFSLEMTDMQLVRKFLSMEAQINSKYFNNAAKITESQWKALSNASGQIYDKGIYIDQSSQLKASEVFIRGRQFKTLYPKTGLIVIDYLQLLAPETNQGTKNDKTAETSRTIKLMAKELDLPLLVLSQLSRATELRQDKVPTLADLRDSGSLEQDADMVTFLYREDYYDKEKKSNDLSPIQWVIAKNRGDGGIGLVELNYFKTIQRYESVEKHQTIVQAPLFEKTRSSGSNREYYD